MLISNMTKAFSNSSPKNTQIKQFLNTEKFKVTDFKNDNSFFQIPVQKDPYTIFPAQNQKFLLFT